MAKVLARRVARSKLSPALFAFSLLAAPALQASELSRNEVTTYRNAITAASNGRSAQAVRSVSRTQNEVAKDVVQWYALQQGSIPADFNTYASFIRNHADWPRCIEIENKLQCDLLRKQAELRVSESSNPASVVEHFTANPPLSMRGLVAYAGALDKTGHAGDAEAAIKTFWVNGSMSLKEQNDYLNQYGRVLTEADREARADRLLWDGATESARDLASSLSDDGFRAAVHARIALQTNAANAATLLAAVPDSHRNAPGIDYDRARRLANKDDEEAAARILIAHGPATNGKASSWWNLRERVARELLAQGDAPRAYQVASQHGLTAADGLSYLSAEWTSGWIALRFTGNADKAAVHFKQMYDASTSVLSKARGSYWLGRALQAQGHEEVSKQWYATAARFGTTFYGQAAAHDLYGDVLIQPPQTPEPSREAHALFATRDMVRAVRVGVEIGNRSVAKAFINALADASKSQDEATLAVELGTELHRPDLAAWAAKRVGRLGYDVPAAGYPTLPFRVPSEPEAPLIHSITRQESTFDQYARSPATAQGMMQLLPATAAKQARDSGIPHQESWLISKPEHNVRLGSAYLQGRISAFDNSYILGIAAYNAGPGRSVRWRERYGEPGNLRIPSATKAGEPALWGRIDWVELIPFSETRDYVQYVLAGTEVYRAILNKGDTPAHLRLRNNLER